MYFVTQNPLDIPEKVLGQLGNRVQHALRAFTPRDQKAVRSVAETMRANPKIDTANAILELAVGEALVSLLDAKGAPGITERVRSCRPSRLGPITADERAKLMSGSTWPVNTTRWSIANPRSSGSRRAPARRLRPPRPVPAAARVRGERRRHGRTFGHPVRVD